MTTLLNRNPITEAAPSILTDLPTLFRGAILVYSILLIGVAIYLIMRNRRVSKELNGSMIEAHERIRELDRCQIENLDPVLAALREDETEALSDAAMRIEDDAERLYQRKWIAAPETYLASQELMRDGVIPTINYEHALQLLALGMVGTAFAMLFALNFLEVSRPLALQFSLISVLAGAIACILLVIQVYRIRNSVQAQSTALAKSIRRRVPVFEELSGTAALIESFVRYDRDMSQSVAQLTGTVEDLSRNKMVELIAQNLSTTLRQELAPPLRDSQESLALLARELMRLQADGIQQMSAAFVDELSRSMNQHLDQMIMRIDTLAGRLEAHTEQFAAVENQLQVFAHQTEINTAELHDARQQLTSQRQSFLNDLTESRHIQQQMNDTLAKLEAIHSGDLEGISHSLGQLSNTLHAHIDHLHKNQADLTKLNEKSQSTVSQFERNSESVLRNIRDQINEMQAQTSSISRSQQETATAISELNKQLNTSVSLFSENMEAHVDQTLAQFDQGLGEVAERLGSTTKDLRDSVDHIQSTLRSSHEANDV